VTDVCLPTFGSGHPMLFRPGRIVSDILLVAAFEFGNPIQSLVQMKAHDFSRLTRRRLAKRVLLFHRRTF